MDNVIRPSFGQRPQPASTEPPASEDGYQPLHVYGQAAGHLVALIEDASGPEGLVLKVVSTRRGRYATRLGLRMGEEG